jgi:hypothetical protein
MPFCAATIPAQPTPFDFVSIGVSGDLPDNCYSATSASSLSGGVVDVTVQVSYTAPPGTICTQIPEPFEVTEDVGTLTEGTYRADITYLHPWCSPDPCTGSMTFDVRSDVDGDLVPDAWDNCTNDPNPIQGDADEDALGDTCDPDDDGDLIYDTDEPTCGSDPMDITPPLSRPERIDGAFVDVDDDGDGGVDEPLPAGSEAHDCDGDGYTGSTEAHVFGDTNVRDQDPCGTDAWPSDFVSGGPFGSTNAVRIDDLNTFLSPRRLDTDPGDPNYDVRWDLSPGAGIFGTVINIGDLNALLGGPTANPPMLGGERALGGPECPWPP